MINKHKLFISLETLLFIWYTWRIGYGTAISGTMFWLIVGTIVNILCWYMLFRNLYVAWKGKYTAIAVCFAIFCWYCWRIPNDVGNTWLQTFVYQFIDISTWFVAGTNLVYLIKGIIPKFGRTAMVKA